MKLTEILKKGLVILTLALMVQSLVFAQWPTASEQASGMQIGWNIGNSLEVPGSETGWGNPLVTQTLVNAVKAAGFNTIRIPCAWDSYADQSTYEISSTWLARVAEVVNYGLNNNMYVILNSHWDNGWLEEHPFYANQDAVNAKQEAYWTQIANYFESYGSNLIFAGTNEVRADYGEPTSEYIEVQESYNQTFVDAVRSTGGNNTNRNLIVQFYNTNFWHGLNYFTPPSDVVSGHMYLEGHHYDPYDFTLNPDNNAACIVWGSPWSSGDVCTWGQEDYTDDLFGQIKSRFVNQGYPIILGEYGVAKRTSLSGTDLTDHTESRLYYLEYVTAAAKDNGFIPVYWDNGYNGDMGFALFDRNSGAVVDQSTIDALMEGAGTDPQPTYYTLSTSTSGSGSISVSPSGGSYLSGTTVTLTATASSGYEFTGWSGDLSGSSNPATITMNSNKSVTAIFTEIGTTQYTLSTSTNGSGSISLNPSGGVYDQGTVVTLTANASSGYEFSGWSGALSGTNNPASLTMNSNLSVTATFTQISTQDSYTLQENTTGFCNVDGSVDNNHDGFTGTGFANTSNAAGNGIDYKINASGGSATLTFRYANGSSDRPGDIILNGSTVVSNLSMPSSGSWSTWTTVSTTVTLPSGISDLRLEATSSGGLANIDYLEITAAGINAADCNGTTPETYSLTTSVSGSGSVNPSSGTYDEGTVISLTATPSSGYEFSSWSGDLSGSSNPASLTMNSDKSVTAIFTSTQTTQYTLTTSTSGSGSISLNPSGNVYDDGTVVTLTATPSSGYVFSGWSGAISGSTNPATLTMNSNMSVTATFTEEATGEVCDNPTSISIPFTQEGVGEYCFVTSADIAYINSWSMDVLEINGEDYTNIWSNSFPAKINGNYYIYYVGSVPWSHWEASAVKGAPMAADIRTEIHLYPNPFNQSINIVIDNPEQVSRIVVLDQLGRVVSDIDQSSIAYSFKIGENLDAGLYIIQVYDNQGLQNFTINKK